MVPILLLRIPRVDDRHSRLKAIGFIVASFSLESVWLKILDNFKLLF